jgi:uncharacterized repeat protein (TIGR03806 family)
MRTFEALAVGSVFCVVACSSGSKADSGSLLSGAGTANNPSAGTSGGGASNGGGIGHAGGGIGGVHSAGASGEGGNAGNGSVIGACVPPLDVYAPIEKLSQTGCMDPSDPKKFSPRAIRYELNSPLWSDAADKARAFVLPTGKKIRIRDCKQVPSDCPAGMADDGRWDFPIGTVMIKSFMFDAKLVETRLFMHMNDGTWVGYGYQWNEAQTEATIVPFDRVATTFDTGKRKVTWQYPSRKDCMDCHNDKSGSTLGPETAQMNRLVDSRNQIDAFAELGLFETAPAKPYKTALVAPYATPQDNPPVGATDEQKARSYLHANCAFCHRPDGLFPNFDLRYDVALKDMKICNVNAIKGTIGSSTSTTLLKPGAETESVLWQRMNQSNPDDGRMPQIGSYVIDDAGQKTVAAWIHGLKSCP